MSRHGDIPAEAAKSGEASGEKGHLNLANLTQPERPQQNTCTENISTQELSRVGIYQTTKVETYTECAQAAHPSMAHDFHTIDKNTTLPVRLDQIFNTTDIYNALVKDKVVSKALNDANLHPTNYSDLQDMLQNKSIFVDNDAKGGEIHSMLNDKILSNFAFLDVKGDKVAVRLLMDYAGEAARYSEDQLGILLPIPRSLRQDLLEASQGKHGNFLMKDSETKGAKHRYERTYPFEF
jgi:hypothetical protein